MRSTPIAFFTSLLLTALASVGFASVASAYAGFSQDAEPLTDGESARVEVVNLLLANETADDFFAEGELARDRGEISPALIAFLTAFRMEQDRFDAAFEIARLFTAWDEAELGWLWLERALDAGYWSTSELRRDTALAPLRTRPGFSRLITQAQENYRQALPHLRGLTEVRKPEGPAPAGGWPILLCLHGYGADQRDLIALAEVAASQGYYAITVCGYQPVSPGRYAWPDEGAAISAYLDGVLKTFSQEPACNGNIIYTTGFSQGGLVATYLVASKPDRFLGAIPISPAGPLSVPKPKAGAAARPIYMLYGSAEGPGVKANVQRFRREFEAGGSRVEIVTHPGGHTFPSNWSEVLVQGLKFVSARG